MMSLIDYLDSPEMEKARKAMRDAINQYEGETRAWWDGLSEKEREDAFYMVCKLIHKGDVEEQGSYRHVLYHTLGFDMAMYGQGMECGYMDIHNLIHDGLELRRIHKAENIDINLCDDILKSYGAQSKIKFNLTVKERDGKAYIAVAVIPVEK